MPFSTLVFLIYFGSKSDTENEIYISAFEQGVVILALQRHLWTFSFYCAYSKSSVAAESTSFSDYDCIFRLFAAVSYWNIDL